MPVGPDLVHSAGALLRVARADGLRGVGQRFARRAYVALDAGSSEFPLLPEDIADSSCLTLPPSPGAPSGQPLRVTVVTTPPAPGSGGHTTLFRMIEALEGAGHLCTLHLYDTFHGDPVRHAKVIRRWWPQIRADIKGMSATIAPADAVIATSWQTAHVVASRATFPTARLYLVQDYEPFFYPRGSLYALAEDTYRFGFTCIAIGNMVAQLLEEECGVIAATATFGCDTDVYRTTRRGQRNGVAFYARPGVPRRGYELAKLALADFAVQHPTHTIHVFGDPPKELPFPAVRHGRLSPEELSVLYNDCVAGVALSFTNISLAAAEMLACGVVPVVNDHPFARADLTHPAVVWASPTPRGMSAGLSAAVDQQSSAALLASQGHVEQGAWSAAQRTFLRAVTIATQSPVGSDHPPAGRLLR